LVLSIGRQSPGIAVDSYLWAASAIDIHNETKGVLIKAASSYEPKSPTYELVGPVVNERHRLLVEKIVTRLRLNKHGTEVDQEEDNDTTISANFAELALATAVVAAAKEGTPCNLLSAPAAVVQAQEAAAAAWHTLLQSRLSPAGASAFLGDSILAIPSYREMKKLRDKEWFIYSKTM